MNPLKLIDAGADLLSKTVKNTGRSVADRIAGLRRSGEDEGAADGQARLDQLRIALSIDKFTDADSALYRLALIDKRTNQEVSAVERRWADCEPVLQMLRGMYPKLEVPAAPPRAGSRAVAVVVEERRKYVQAFLNVCAAHAGASKQKELQQLCGFGIHGASPARSDMSRVTASPQASNTSFGGSTTPKTTPRERSQSLNSSFADAAAAAAATPNQDTREAKGQQREQQLQQLRQRREEQEREPARQVKFAAHDTPSEPPTSGAAGAQAAGPAAAAASAPLDERPLIDECFKLVDVDSSGLVTKDELEEFIASLPRHVTSRAVEGCIKEVDTKNTGAFDAKTFRLFVTRLAQVTRVAAEDMWRSFRRRKLVEVYEAIGSPAKAEASDIDREELRPLLLVLQTGGLKQLAPSVLAAVEFAVPYTYEEYEDVMDLLLRVIPAHELLKAVRASDMSHGQTLGVINKYAAKAPAALARQLKDMVGRYGGSSCSNCAAVQAKHDALAQQVRHLQAEKEAMAAQLQAAQAAQKEAEAAARAAQVTVAERESGIAKLQEEAEQLRREVVEATAAKSALQDKVCEVEAELDIERDARRKRKAGADDFEYATDSDEESLAASEADEAAERDALAAAAALARRVNVHYLVPAHLASHEEAPVVDKPGAIVYDVAEQVGATPGEPYFPMGFATDVFIADPRVPEYFALRTPQLSDGRTGRALAWSFEDGQFCCGWLGRRAPIATGKWVRLSVKIRWEAATFDVAFDGVATPELTALPFRDRHAAGGGAGTLDIFPRDATAVYYANMHFFR